MRDGRIPLSTQHPQVPEWCSGKTRLIVLNRQDMISARDREDWTQHYNRRGEKIFWTQGKRGQGVNPLRRVAAQAGDTINEKRTQRGLKPRPVRAVMIGFPNVGKSALINRLCGERKVDSAPRAGVTRQLRWVRIGAIPWTPNDVFFESTCLCCGGLTHAPCLSYCV